MADRIREGILVELGANAAPLIGGINLAKASVAGFAGFAVMELAKFSRASADASKRWERSMAEIATIADTTAAGMATMRKEMRDLSVQFGQDFEKVARARYDVISSGFTRAADSARLMRDASELAVGGLTDVSVAARVLANVINAYNLTAAESDKIDDQLFATVRVGVLTFEELAQNLGEVTSTAYAAKVPLTDLLAALATITQGGVVAPEAVTALNRLISSFISPSKEARKEMDALGLTLKDGLGPMLERVATLAERDVTAVAKALPEIRALKGALTGAANEGKRFADAQKAIAESSGDAERAAAVMSDTEAELEKRLKASREAMHAAFGEIGKQDREAWLRWQIAWAKGWEGIAGAIERARREQARYSSMMGGGIAGGSMGRFSGMSTASTGLTPGQLAGVVRQPLTGGPPTMASLAAAAAASEAKRKAEAERLAAESAALWAANIQNGADALRKYNAERQTGLYGMPLPPGVDASGTPWATRGFSGAMQDATSGMMGASERNAAAFDREMRTAGRVPGRPKSGPGSEDAYQKARQELAVYGQMAQTIMGNTSALIESGIYGGLINAFGGGQSAMAQFAAATLSQLATIIVRATLLKTILGTIGLGGFFESGGYTGGPSQYAWGGYTGASTGGKIAGYVHEREFVLNERATRQIGTHVLERLNAGFAQSVQVGDIHIHGSSTDINRQIAREIQAGLPYALRDIARTGRDRYAKKIGG